MTKFIKVYILSVSVEFSQPEFPKMQTARFLTPTELINSQLVETSLNGVYGLLMFIEDVNPDALVWAVIKLVKGDWKLVYFAGSCQEDAADVFGVYDEADFESSFDLFDHAEAAVLNAA